MNISHSLSKLDDIDWDYLGDQSESPFASAHFHPGRFISQIPATLIGRLSKPGDVILDPYCGSGTTLVEAQRLGRIPIGIDLNPASILISKSKLIGSRASLIKTLLGGHLHRFLDSGFVANGNFREVDVTAPTGVQLTKWYHPNTAKELLEIWGYISHQKGKGKLLLQFAFSSILMQACSENRHWGYICDNTRPLSHNYVNAIDLFSKFINKLLCAYVDRDTEISFSTKFPLPKASIYEGDALSTLKNLPSSSVDLVITSPPYFGVIDYIKAQRLTMEWFGYDIQELRLKETGARSKRNRINSYSEYVTSLDNVLCETSRVLKKGSSLTLLIGQSRSRENPLPDIVKSATNAGFKLERDFSRDVTSRRRQAPSLKKETLFIFSI